jgi:hypothetical protein
MPGLSRHPPGGKRPVGEWNPAQGRGDVVDWLDLPACREAGKLVAIGALRQKHLAEFAV